MNLVPLKRGVWTFNGGQHLLLAVDNPSDILNTFPQNSAKVYTLKGRRFVATHFCRDTVRLLRNLRYDTSGLEYVRFERELPKIRGTNDLRWDQLATADFLIENPRAYCTSTPRVGKTAATVLAARTLQLNRQATAALIVAPMSALWSVWEDEIAGMYPTATTVVVYDTNKDKRRKLLQKQADFYVINYDGLKLLLPELCEMVIAGVIDICVLDELTFMQNTRSALWDAGNQILNGKRFQVYPGRQVRQIDGTVTTGKPTRRSLPDVKGVTYVWGLTGTPGGPEQVYGQVKLLTASNMQMSYSTWRDQTMVCVDKYKFKWVPAIGYKEKIHNAMQPCIRFDKKDVLPNQADIPVRGRDCLLSTEQSRMLKKLRQEASVYSDSGFVVEASSKSALSNKLLQIACGVVIGNDGPIEVDMKPRLDEIVSIIEETDRKVIIYSAFKAVMKRLQQALIDLGYPTARVDGDVTGHKRGNIFKSFMSDDKYRVIVCHPRTTAFAVEMASANRMVFCGPPLSGDFIFEQAMHRMNSARQTSDDCVVYLLSATPEERKLFADIRMGVSINQGINNMFTCMVKNASQ